MSYDSAEREKKLLAQNRRLEKLREREAREAKLKELLPRDHTLNGGMLSGLEGTIVEVQGRAMSVLDAPLPWGAPGKNRPSRKNDRRPSVPATNLNVVGRILSRYEQESL